MRSTLAAALVFAALPLAAQVSAPGALYKSEAEGWQIQMPKAWKYAPNAGKLGIGSDTEAGLMFAWFQPGLTLEQAKQYATQPYQEQGLVLNPTGSAAFTSAKGTSAIATNYSGTAADGSTIKARAVTVVGAKGAVVAGGLTTEPQFAALAKRVDELAKGVAFFTPKAGAGVAFLSGPICAWSGGSNYSSSKRMTFDGKGNVGWGSEMTFSGEIKNGQGDTTATYGGWTGNQHQPSDRGVYTVAGDSVTITWGDGSVMSCAVHYRNGQQITELKCGDKLWGRGLCE